jgi:hypothetical protein
MARIPDSGTAGSPSGHASSHRGERYGLPAEGVGSVAGFGRRLAGVAVDWLIAYAGVLAVMGLDAVGGPTIGWWVWGVWRS